MAVFTGAGVAIITPFRADGSVNYEKLEELIEFHCAHGTDAVVVCATTGEASTLSREEQISCIKFTVEKTRKRLPVIAGTGSNDTAAAVAMSREAKEAGADGLLIVTPYYNKTTQKGLYEHYMAIAREVKTPIILYSVAGRTGLNIEPETAAALVRDAENIVGIKEASGSISQAAKIMNAAGGRIELYAGNDDQIVPFLSLGGKGVISVLSNIAPQETHDICEEFFEGRIERARELQLRAIPLIESLFCEVNPIPVKKALALMGMECGGLRMPLTELSPAHTLSLKKAMEEFGLLPAKKGGGGRTW